MRTALAALAALALCLPTPADAAPSDDRGHVVALSVSPLHLLLPMFEATAEIYASDVFSVALVGGVGSVTVEDGYGDEVTLTAVEVGGQVRAYFYGSTEEGAYAAGEFLYVAVDGTVDGVVGLGQGTSFGPLLGYKWVWSHFFIDLAVGGSYLVATAEASDGVNTVEDSESEFGLNVNFNLGAAF